MFIQLYAAFIVWSTFLNIQLVLGGNQGFLRESIAEKNQANPLKVPAPISLPVKAPAPVPVIAPAPISCSSVSTTSAASLVGKDNAPVIGTGSKVCWIFDASSCATCACKYYVKYRCDELTVV